MLSVANAKILRFPKICPEFSYFGCVTKADNPNYYINYYIYIYICVLFCFNIVMAQEE